jgi:hypothetical protein
MNEQQERVAQAIYLKMPGSEAHPWVEGGNSLKQDEARAYARAALAAQGVQKCGHPLSMLVKSAETGEPLYCEACDDKSARRDAEQREAELLASNAELRAKQAAQGAPADPHLMAKHNALHTNHIALKEDVRKISDALTSVGLTLIRREHGYEVRRFGKVVAQATPAQAQQAAEVTLPPIPCHPEPHSHRWSKLEEATIKAYGGLCAIVAQAATKAAPAQAQQAAPLTDEQIEAIGHRKAWRYKHSSDPAHSSTYTFNRVCLLDFARAAIDAARGIGASSGSAP